MNTKSLILSMFWKCFGILVWQQHEYNCQFVIHEKAYSEEILSELKLTFYLQISAYCKHVRTPCANIKTNLMYLTVSILPSGCMVYIYVEMYITISIGKSPFTCLSKVSFQVCCVLSFSAESVWLRSQNHIYCSALKMCKCCKTIFVLNEKHFDFNIT